MRSIGDELKDISKIRGVRPLAFAMSTILAIGVVNSLAEHGPEAVVDMAATPDTLPPGVAKVVPAIVRLLVERPDGTLTAGSGVRLKDGRSLTASHVVADEDATRQKAACGGVKISAASKPYEQHDVDRSGITVPAGEIRALPMDEKDFAVVTVPTSSQNTLGPAPDIAVRSRPVVVGEVLYSIGWGIDSDGHSRSPTETSDAMLAEPHIVGGVVMGIGRNPDHHGQIVMAQGIADYSALPNRDMAIAHGDSGGAVVDSNGEVVAVVAAVAKNDRPINLTLLARAHGLEDAHYKNVPADYLPQLGFATPTTPIDTQAVAGLSPLACEK